jgi:predicted anti-sigma-YlaC factor YlaD
MDCKLVEKKIYQYLYGEGKSYELKKIKEHLDICGRCRKESEIIADILHQLSDGMEDEPVPEGFRERMLRRIQAEAG